MKTLIILMSLGFIGTVFLVGCGPTAHVSDEDVTKNLHYFQDKRTHLCYAYWKGGAITCVPCEQAQPMVENSWSR